MGQKKITGNDRHTVNVAVTNYLIAHPDAKVVSSTAKEHKRRSDSHNRLLGNQKHHRKKGTEIVRNLYAVTIETTNNQ